jgi:hypothetical protein
VGENCCGLWHWYRYSKSQESNILGGCENSVFINKSWFPKNKLLLIHILPRFFSKTFNKIAKICHQTKINDEECNINYTSWFFSVAYEAKTFVWLFLVAEDAPFISNSVLNCQGEAQAKKKCFWRYCVTRSKGEKRVKTARFIYMWFSLCSQTYI